MSAIANAAKEDEGLFRRMLERLPAGAYTCDVNGLITYYNQHALAVWGRAPKLNDPEDRFCGSFRLFGADSTPIAHADCWMALALRNRREYLAQEIVVERPDRSRITVLAYATPLLDPDGEVVAGVNMLVNITDQKRLENLLHQTSRSKEFYLAALVDELRYELGAMRSSVDAIERLARVHPDFVQPVQTLRAHLTQIAGLADDLMDVKEIGREVPNA
ncbi:MAG TPA: PAS domain-containing protein [Lysobacter sp.]